MKNRKLEAKILKFIVYLAMTICLISLISIVGYVAIKGIGYVSLDMFSLEYNSDNVSLLPALINTIVIMIFTLIISIIIGVSSAIYLNEYSKRNNFFVKIVRLSIQTLQSTPSIVYGLFGSLLFVNIIFKGYSILSGILTLSIMILPLVIINTEEALKVVPSSLKEASYGLGAGKLRTIIKVVLPSSLPGIFSGIMLAIGRIFGESAALIYTAGTVAQIATSYDSAGRTLAVHMYALWSEGINIEKSYATSFALLVVVILINIISAVFNKRLEKKLNGY